MFDLDDDGWDNEEEEETDLLADEGDSASDEEDVDSSEFEESMPGAAFIQANEKSDEPTDDDTGRSPGGIVGQLQTLDRSSGNLEEEVSEACNILSRSASGPWKNLSWDEISASAQARVSYWNIDGRRFRRPELIEQGNLSLCGPACVLEALADTDPVGYAQLIHKIFTEGKIGDTPVCEDLLNGSPLPGMNPADWMALSAMRDTENAVFDYEGTPGEDFSGITLPSEVEGWMESLLGCTQTETYTSYLFGEACNADKISSLLAQYGEDKVIVEMLVDANALTSTDSLANYPNHWIRLLSPITRENSRVSFTAYSWGAERKFDFSEEEFEDVQWEFVVGTKDNTIWLPD